MKNKKQKIFTLKGLIFCQAIFIIICVLPVFSFGAAAVTNVVVSPATVAPGGSLTVNFQLQANNGQAQRVAIFLSPDTALSICSEDWVFGASGIYGPSTQYTIGGSNRNAASIQRTTWVTGELQTSGGVNVGNGTGSPQSVTVVVKVPPEFSSNFYVGVVAREGTWLSSSCVDNNQTIDGSAQFSGAVAVSGPSTPYKLDLELCDGGSNNVHIYVRDKIVNRSESGIRVKNLKWRWYLSASPVLTVNNAQDDRAYNADGSAAHNNNLNPAGGGRFAMTSAACTGSRNADQYYERAWTNGYGSYPDGMIGGGGSYISSYTISNIDLTPASGTFVYTDDYTRPSDIGACTSINAMSDTKYATVYYNNTLMCEWSDSVADGGSDVMDPATGEEPCAISGCVLGINLAKSANVSYAYIGDTITYCLTYTNVSSSDKDTDIWDTVPANTLYLGCDNGCDVVGGTVVHWFKTVGAGYSGTVCFWVKVTGYPYFPTGRDYLACLRQKETEIFDNLNKAYSINKNIFVFEGIQD